MQSKTTGTPIIKIFTSKVTKTEVETVETSDEKEVPESEEVEEETA